MYNFNFKKFKQLIANTVTDVWFFENFASIEDIKKI